MAIVSLLSGENCFRYLVICYMFSQCCDRITSTKIELYFKYEINFLRAYNPLSRIPESFPCLHDKVLAAAADAAFSFSSSQKKKQVQINNISLCRFILSIIFYL